MEIKNKVVLITGSSSGIGKHTAIRFAAEGAKVVINYRVNKVGAEETKSEIEGQGGECIIVQADVSKSEDINNLFDEIVKQYKTLDILINNAAIPNDKVPFLETTDDLI
ncbi:SDR family NAD(P)-dependent oxidoreductase [Candidatus Dojkabacteria bacterium]|uniref:SDR family NAD(P)-dependent oxidoreductase n=1 Tax=Candidatus Dojkabacteria bacterium TaxID=2099670 RepID=A0A955I902_9BACT|nr:SDR family NAD(P)-dependent oxidoreductase [Candidatus Dojkabacteria bacterium]